jgi:DNA-binding PadR family transcriptional regulator
MDGQRELEARVIRKFNERILNCFLDVVILSQIEKQSLSGYDLIGHIFKSYGILMSAGTIYATMYSLERDGLVVSSFDGKKNVFRLTERGTFTLEVVRTSPEVKNFMIKLIHDKIKNLAIS